MPSKKAKSPETLEALRQVRKPLPPPTRTKADEKKYRRGAARRLVRQEIEQEAKKE